MLKALKQQGVSGPIRTILRNVYYDATASMKMDPPGPKFDIARGVRQGDPLSPKLFNATLEDVFRYCMLHNEAGVSIDGERLLDLRFADDVIVIDDDDRGHLQETITELNSRGKECGLTVN